MLEKNEKKLIFDAHFHYFDCKKLNILDFPADYSAISCAHSIEEWECQSKAPDFIIQAYGIHPQSLTGKDITYVDTQIQFINELLHQNKIKAIGECGFDFFTDEFKNTKELQEIAFVKQIEFAINNNLPVIIHCRKANEKLFEYSDKLSKLPEVLFHSFMGSSIEGMSLLNRGINAYFSFGKQIFNNNKKVIDCVKNLPENRILGETDAPFQCLKGETYTKPVEIIKILEGIENLQKEK